MPLLKLEDEAVLKFDFTKWYYEVLRPDFIMSYYVNTKKTQV